MGTGPIKEVKRIAEPSRAFCPHVHDEFSIAHIWCGTTLVWQGRFLAGSMRQIGVLQPSLNPSAHAADMGACPEHPVARGADPVVVIEGAGAG